MGLRLRRSTDASPSSQILRRTGMSGDPRFGQAHPTRSFRVHFSSWWKTCEVTSWAMRNTCVEPSGWRNVCLRNRDAVVLIVKAVLLESTNPEDSNAPHRDGSERRVYHSRLSQIMNHLIEGKNVSFSKPEMKAQCDSANPSLCTYLAQYVWIAH